MTQPQRRGARDCRRCSRPRLPWCCAPIGLTKAYAGGPPALAGLTVDVPAGSVGLVGANGAGKTTLFRLMLGLMQPTSGRIEVAGRDVATDPVGIRSRLGYMPEHDCLPLDQTASDVVATFGELAGLPARAARQRASDVLDLVGLDEARFRPVGGFSTGMRQRTKLAQALVADPQLVLLDEPTAGLDPLGREEMLDLVGRLAGFGISVILATHLLDDVQRVCEHVVMIDRGRLVLAGPIDQLMQTTGQCGSRSAAGRRRRRAGRGPRRAGACASRRSTSTASTSTPASTGDAAVRHRPRRRSPTSACACTPCRPATARSTTCSSQQAGR